MSFLFFLFKGFRHTIPAIQAQLALGRPGPSDEHDDDGGDGNGDGGDGDGGDRDGGDGDGGDRDGGDGDGDGDGNSEVLPGWLQFASLCLREQPNHLSPD